MTNQPAAPAAIPGAVPALRVRGGNPNHHLWFNHGSWWMHYTVHLPDHTKHRVRCSLRTGSLEVARARRDALLAEFGDIWKAAA